MIVVGRVVAVAVAVAVVVAVAVAVLGGSVGVARAVARADAIKGLVDHPLVRAVTFVGSSPVAKLVSNRCRALDKRCSALGVAKNHLVLLPDCNVETTASNVVMSFAGCAGQRCMAASVLLIVGDDDGDGGGGPPLLRMVIKKASKILRGKGPSRWARSLTPSS